MKSASGTAAGCNAPDCASVYRAYLRQHKHNNSSLEGWTDREKTTWSSMVHGLYDYKMWGVCLSEGCVCPRSQLAITGQFFSHLLTGTELSGNWPQILTAQAVIQKACLTVHSVNRFDFTADFNSCSLDID